MRLPHKGRALTIASIAAIGVLAVSGIAVATIPGGDGVIHGCYAKKGGSVKVIDIGKGQTCPTGYLPLNWAQEGVPGEDGDDGAPGDDGQSAYEIWLAAGNAGTEDDFLATLKGEQGEAGPGFNDNSLSGWQVPRGASTQEPRVAGFFSRSDGDSCNVVFRNATSDPVPLWVTVNAVTNAFTVAPQTQFYVVGNVPANTSAMVTYRGTSSAGDFTVQGWVTAGADCFSDVSWRIG